MAVMELFTSQGCSSCPPADQLVSDIMQEARQTGQNIFALSFHIDYWDRFGWKDPYSHATNTDRQKAYSQVFNGSTIYTPQMIINGKVHFSGSNRSATSQEIKEALGQKVRNGIELMARCIERRLIQVSYKIAGALPAKSVLNLALVESGLTTSVKRGENAGRTLYNDNVVRVFHSEKVSDTVGLAKITVPFDVDPKQSIVIAYLQSSDYKTIYGASKKAVTP